MKNIYSYMILFFALLSTQWVSAQCTGTISASGSGATYTFTSTNPTGPMMNHYWDFGDGTYGTGQSVSHTFTVAGTYMVTGGFSDSLNICYDNDSVFVNVFISGSPNCTAAFTTAGTSPTFTFTPTGTPIAPPGYFSYDWDFGDGNVAWGNLNPTHTYTANGTYTVECILYDSIFCSDTVINTVVVTGIGGASCDATFTYIDNNGTVSFTPSFPFSGADYSWDFGDGTSSNIQNPTHTFSTAGTYNVWFQISELNGCFDSVLVAIQVGSPTTCDASFTSVNQGTYYSFTPNNYDANASYLWDFGDGNTFTLGYATHHYSVSGTFIVSCSMTTPSGCSDVKTDTIIIILVPQSISGTVNAGTSPADFGVVFLIDSTTFTLMDTVLIDSIGAYSFQNVANGTYFVKAALSPASNNYLNYLPTYYTNSLIPSSLLWSSATGITLNGWGSWSMQDIDLIGGVNPGGPGFIGGLVSQGANKVGDPISDIPIMITDDLGNPVAYAYSDHLGAFTIDDLAYGNYTVYPEIAGKTTTPFDIVLSDSYIGTNDIRVTVNSTTVEATIVSGIKGLTAFKSVQLYPNPVVDYMHIDLGKDFKGSVNMTISNLAGQTIIQYDISGSGLTKVNSTSLNSGFYFLTLENNGNLETIKFIKK